MSHFNFSFDISVRFHHLALVPLFEMINQKCLQLSFTFRNTEIVMIWVLSLINYLLFNRYYLLLYRHNVLDLLFIWNGRIAYSILYHIIDSQQNNVFGISINYNFLVDTIIKFIYKKIILYKNKYIVQFCCNCLTYIFYTNI